MKKEEIFEKVVEILTNHFAVSKEEVSLNTNPAKDLDLDSLDIAEFQMECENVFLVYMEDETLEKLKTIGNIVDYIDILIQNRDAIHEKFSL